VTAEIRQAVPADARVLAELRWEFRSAKTPSTFGIPNSCAASAILEKGDKTQLTLDPNLFKRSCAICSACASRSRLINLPEEILSAMASEWPPAPSVASM